MAIDCLLILLEDVYSYQAAERVRYDGVTSVPMLYPRGYDVVHALNNTTGVILAD